MAGSILDIIPEQPLQDPVLEIFSARVNYTLLDDKSQPQIFSQFGGWSNLGSIFFNRLNNPTPTGTFTYNNFAKPLYPNSKTFPLKNELVYVIALPNSNIQNNVNSVVYYYFNPINIWNSIHHNAVPNPIDGNTLPPSQQQDYQQTEAGAVRQSSDGSTEIDLGPFFKEKLDIKNLQPFEGDVLHEGRWGQSIRFSSTVKNLETNESKTPWSSTGISGDPIIIVRNGQHDDGKKAWIPQIEDVNKDKSSIYVTSTQTIPVEGASTEYRSYSSAPQKPNVYNKEQIILNSGRLFFNSKTDHILLSSKQSINLNAIKSINIDSPKFIVDTDSKDKSVLLGTKTANQSLILGDTFLKDLAQLLKGIAQLSQALTTPIGTPAPFAINGAIPAPAQQLLNTAVNMLNSIEKYKSKVSKTV